MRQQIGAGGAVGGIWKTVGKARGWHRSVSRGTNVELDPAGDHWRVVEQLKVLAIDVYRRQRVDAASSSLRSTLLAKRRRETPRRSRRPSAASVANSRARP